MWAHSSQRSFLMCLHGSMLEDGVFMSIRGLRQYVLLHPFVDVAHWMHGIVLSGFTVINSNSFNKLYCTWVWRFTHALQRSLEKLARFLQNLLVPCFVRYNDCNNFAATIHMCQSIALQSCYQNLWHRCSSKHVSPPYAPQTLLNKEFEVDHLQSPNNPFKQVHA